MRVFLYFRSETRILKEKVVQKADCFISIVVKITSDISNRSQMFFKAGDLKISAIFTRKHLR